MPTVATSKRAAPAGAKKRKASRVSSKSSAGPRKDVESRAADISVGLESVWNAPKNLFLCWVQKNNAGYYEAMGYQPEVHRADGIRCRADRYSPEKEGKEIELYGDCILMSIDKAERKRIEQEGVNGRGGLRRVERMERAIVRNRQGIYGNEPSRGIFNSRYFGIVNETEQEESVRLSDWAD